MENKLLLVKIITLLFLESVSNQKNNSSRDLAAIAVGQIKTPDATVLTDFSRDSLGHLLDIARWMIGGTPESGFDKNDILQRVRVATETENFIYDALASAIEGEKTPEEIIKITRSARDYINESINRNVVTNIVRDAYFQVQFKSEGVDWNHYVKELLLKLDPYKNTQTHTKTSLVESIDFANMDSIQESFKMAVQSIGADGILKFGWQAFNRMFGEYGGARRGDINSPVLVGGGRVFGPKPRDYRFKLNKKVKNLARRSALSYKAQEQAILVVEDFNFEAPKTKDFVNIAKNLKVDGKKLLLLLPEANKNVFLSARNLQKAHVMVAKDVNTYKILDADVLIVTENSLKAVEGILNK